VTIGSTSRTARPTLPSFWLLHAAGWLAYGLAMTVSRVGMFPLRYMVVSKGMLMVMGLLISLGLRYVYRPLIRRGTPLLVLLVVAVVASYVASLVWTAARVRLGLSGSALWNRRQSRCKEKRPGDFHRAVSLCVNWSG